MATILETFLKPFLKENLPDIRPGDTVRVYQKIPSLAKGSKEGKGKGKLQVFEGLVIARKHRKEIGATITVRKVISGIGVERIFPLHSPLIEKIEIIKRGKVRRAKLYYIRTAKGRKAKLKKLGLPTEIIESGSLVESKKEVGQEVEKVNKEELEGKEKTGEDAKEETNQKKEIEKD